MRSRTFALALVAGAALACVWGCGKKEAAVTQQQWAGSKYKISASYPSSWKMSETNSVESPKAGTVLIALFHKPDDRGTGKVRERPPMVKIVWAPGTAQPTGPSDLATPEASTMGSAPLSMTGIASGWTEFGAENIQLEHITWPPNIPAERATATARPGTAFFSTYTGQLAGPEQQVRVVSINLSNGHYEITSVAPSTDPALLAETNAIADSIRLTQ